ncbi:MAG TPA: hypothetical protein VG713_18985 [Pirellulales bacterium]|nr:hypothetical protein [Pirellulales bacterium]
MADVELRPAFAWDCESCGRENFARTVVADLLPEDLDVLKQEHGVEAWETGDFVSMPKVVVCQFCDARFGTRDYREDE